MAVPLPVSPVKRKKTGISGRGPTKGSAYLTQIRQARVRKNKIAINKKLPLGFQHALPNPKLRRKPRSTKALPGARSILRGRTI